MVLNGITNMLYRFLFHSIACEFNNYTVIVRKYQGTKLYTPFGIWSVVPSN
jgi:hypothetical protein